MDAKGDLQAFVYHTVRGICDYQESVRIDSSQHGRVVTVAISCDENDLKFVYGKLSHIKAIAIAIAQRNKSMVQLVVVDQE